MGSEAASASINIIKSERRPPRPQSSWVTEYLAKQVKENDEDGDQKEEEAPSLSMGDVFVRRWDPSWNGRERLSLPMEAVAEKNDIDIWVEATPSGRVRGLGRKAAGKALCPYTLRFKWLPAEVATRFPRFENIYQAAKVAVWTPKHCQMLNQKPVFRRSETTLFADMDGGKLVSEITGREALVANADVIGRMVDPAMPAVRSQYPKHLRSCIIGSIDWDDLDAPLLGYGAVRKQYGDQFQKSLKHSAAARQVLDSLGEALKQGKRILIAEPDGPDLYKRSEYLRAGVEEFTEDGLMRVTAQSWQVVSADLTRCFGHCWHVARLLLDLPNVHPAAEPVTRLTLEDCMQKSRQTHDNFRSSKASKTASTKKRRREVLSGVSGVSMEPCISIETPSHPTPDRFPLPPQIPKMPVGWGCQRGGDTPESMAGLEDFYLYLAQSLKAEAYKYGGLPAYKEEVSAEFLKFCERNMFVTYHAVLSPHELYLARKLKLEDTVNDKEVLMRALVFRAFCRETLYDEIEKFLVKGFYDQYEVVFGEDGDVAAAMLSYRRGGGKMIASTHKNIPRKDTVGKGCRDRHVRLTNHVLTQIRIHIEVGEEIYPLLLHSRPFKEISNAILSKKYLGACASRMILGALTPLLPVFSQSLDGTIDVGDGAEGPLLRMLQEAGKCVDPGKKCTGNSLRGKQMREARGQQMREALAQFKQIFEDGLGSASGSYFLATKARVENDLLALGPGKWPESVRQRIRAPFSAGVASLATLEVQLCEFRQHTNWSRRMHPSTQTDDKEATEQPCVRKSARKARQG
jgi:hypothetical protein